MGFLNIINKKKSEFYLENAAQKNHEFPRTFMIPSKDEINALKIGDLIKLIFVFNTPLENGCNAERMWVKITDISNDLFTGTLNNDPYFLKSIKADAPITFKRENIAAVYGGKAPFDEKLLAIVTKKALEKKQINWVIRTDDLENERDSGWQLFYGDESDEYLDDVDNAAIVSLEDILAFEPLLEDVFSSHGYAYEYSEKENKFTEVTE